MKTGQKSLPDKKKSSSDMAAQEKSNGKEAGVPATADAAAKTPTPGAEESIAASAKVSADAGGELATGSDNVMDLETAVAPYEGSISNADQPQSQANAELLLPYQIPVQHSFSSTTTTTATTTTTVRHEDVQLRVDEPQLNADFQDGGALSALAGDLASSSTGDVQVETVTKVTETVTTEAIPAAPEPGASGTVEFGSTGGASGEIVEEPVAVVVKSSSQEVQRLPEEILPSGALEGSGLTGEEAGVGAEVSLSGFGGEDPEPILMVCPPHKSYPEPPIPDSHFIAVCPPEGPVVACSGFVPDHVIVSESVSEAEPTSYFPEQQDLVEVAEIHQQQAVADLETAAESAAESSSSVPQPSAPELRDQLELEFAAATSPQQPEDLPPPFFQQEQAAEAPPSVEGTADWSVTPSSSLPEEAVNEKETGIITGSLKLEQDEATERAPYLQTAESQSRYEEFGQEPYQEQQQQQHSDQEATSHRAASGVVESFEVQDPVSVSVSDVIQTVETRPVVESVSDEAHESRNAWWKEGGQPEAEGEIPVVETVSDQAQQSRQSWWEQSGGGSEPSSSVPQQEELPVEPLPPQPDDLPPIPPPPPPTSEGEEEQAATNPPSIPAEIDAVSPSSDSFPEVIPEPLPSTFDHGTSGGSGGGGDGGGASVESPLSSVDGSTLPTENGEVSASSDEAFSPASVLSPEGSTPASNLSPDGVEPAAAAAASSTKEPIHAQA